MDKMKKERSALEWTVYLITRLVFFFPSIIFFVLSRLNRSVTAFNDAINDTVDFIDS